MAPKLNKQNNSIIFFSLPILFHPFPSSSFPFSAKFNHVCEASIYILRCRKTEERKGPLFDRRKKKELARPSE
ncbi:hypothetical protein H5410_044326 [Solanum commersonii]|uniref:Uncharacterized protein n=1 Tax=Solanum commersonii TaxID=4109 RepID=A0A9J5X9J9_SOLCO|nr:hypothetical protein H5410_044326 [Solanum commersonii]